MNRLIRWIVYNCFFALLPLLISCLLRELLAVAAAPGAHAAELLFFAIAISATAMGDISGEAKQLGWDVLFGVFAGILMIGAVASAVLYGAYMYDTLAVARQAAFRSSITTIALVLAGVLFLFSTTVQVFLTKTDSSGRKQ